MLSSHESHNMFMQHLSVEVVNQPWILLHFLSATMLISDESLGQPNAPTRTTFLLLQQEMQLPFSPLHTPKAGAVQACST